MNIKEFLGQLDAKKIGILILFLIFCVGLGWGIYAMFFRSAAPGPGEAGYVPPGASLPEVGEGGEVDQVGEGGELPTISEHEQKLNQATNVAGGGYTKSLPVIEQKAVGVTLSSAGDGINFYNTEDNKFYVLSGEGDLLPLSNQEFFEVEEVTWSDDNSKAVIEYPDESKVLYDFTKDQAITLAKEVTEPDFSNTGNVAYKYLTDDEENNWLAVADPNGDQVDLVEHLGANAYYVDVNWSPTNQVVALYSEPAGLNKSEVFFIGLQGENFKSLTVDGSHFEGIWSPNGAKLLYSAVNSENNNNPNLWIADAAGDNIGRHKYDLRLRTWASRCVFADSVTIYCAVPQDLPGGSGLFPEVAQNTNDNIYRIDLGTGRSFLIATPVLEDLEDYSIQELHISKDRNNLFFVEQETGKVYKIQLQ